MHRRLLEHAPEVEAYVSELTRHMGRMPAEERALVQEELRQHLEHLVAAHEEVGATSSEAVRAALADFGSAKRLGRRYGAEWRLTHRNPRIGAFVEGFAGLEVGLLLGITLQQTGHPITALVLFCLLALMVGRIQERRRPGYGFYAAVSCSVVLTVLTLPLLVVPAWLGLSLDSPSNLLIPLAVLWGVASGMGSYLAGARQVRNRGLLW